MRSKSIAIALTTVALSIVVTPQAQAVTIGGSQITPSTTLPSVTIPGINSFTIDKIADGITSDAFPFNGFASTASTGTISLGFANDFDLRSFLLWNDINVGQEGIKDFRLDFFNSTNAQISPGFSTTFVAPLGQLAPAEYVFNQVIPGVRRVDLVVLSSQPFTINRIEIREVAFTTGSIASTTSVPEPFTIVGTIIGGTAALRLRKKLKSATSERS
jgi:hypothetical protein